MVLVARCIISHIYLSDLVISTDTKGSITKLIHQIYTKDNTFFRKKSGHFST